MPGPQPPRYSPHKKDLGVVVGQQTVSNSMDILVLCSLGVWEIKLRLYCDEMLALCSCYNAYRQGLFCLETLKKYLHCMDCALILHIFCVTKRDLKKSTGRPIMLHSTMFYNLS